MKFDSTRIDVQSHALLSHGCPPVLTDISVKSRTRCLLVHTAVFLALEEISRPVAQIEQEEREREGDSRDEVNLRATLRFTPEPFKRHDVPAAPLGTWER